MQQQINLYLPEFRKTKDFLDFSSSLRIVYGALILMVLLSAWLFLTRYLEQRDLAEKRQERDAAVGRTAQLLQDFGDQTEDPRLTNQILALEESLFGKQTLHGFLEGGELGNTTGFSEYLADLSRYHIEGLSLTGITLAQGGEQVYLSGQVLRAENVPLYLQSLRNSESFTGKNFETLRIQSSEDDSFSQVLTFDVASKLANDSGN